MGSQYVDSFEENIDISTDTFLENTERVKGLSDYKLRNFYLFLQKNPISYLTETSLIKSMGSL